MEEGVRGAGERREVISTRRVCGSVVLPSFVPNSTRRHQLLATRLRLQPTTGPNTTLHHHTSPKRYIRTIATQARQKRQPNSSALRMHVPAQPQRANPAQHVRGSAPPRTEGAWLGLDALPILDLSRNDSRICNRVGCESFANFTQSSRVRARPAETDKACYFACSLLAAQPPVRVVGLIMIVFSPEFSLPFHSASSYAVGVPCGWRP